MPSIPRCSEKVAAYELPGLRRPTSYCLTSSNVRERIAGPSAARNLPSGPRV